MPFQAAGKARISRMTLLRLKIASVIVILSFVALTEAILSVAPSIKIPTEFGLHFAHVTVCQGDGVCDEGPNF